MKLDYPYNAANAEGDARDLPGCSSFRRTGMGGEPANANAAAPFEEVALSHNPGMGLPDPSPAQRWDRASNPKGNRLELSPLAKNRECQPGCRVCFLAKKYRLTPREVTLIALISSGQSGRAMSQILGVKVKTICEYCVRIHGKIGTHSRLAIGLWAIHEGMVKRVVPPESSRRVQDALRTGSIEPDRR